MAGEGGHCAIEARASANYQSPGDRKGAGLQQVGLVDPASAAVDAGRYASLIFTSMYRGPSMAKSLILCRNVARFGQP